jgi:hypothetical protein
MHFHRTTYVGSFLLAAVAAVTVVALPVRPSGASTGRPSSVVASDWTTFDQNSQRTGVDASGDSFSPASPAWTSPVLDGQLYGQALVFSFRV